jgi:hypothetical protein
MNPMAQLIPLRFELAWRTATISVLIIDASYSMKKFAEVARQAVLGHLKKLGADKERTYLCAIIGFNDESFVILPMTMVDENMLEIDYDPKGDTLLWHTVGVAMAQLRILVSEARRRNQQVDVLVGVISDGDDNRSPEGILGLLHGIVGKALADGWDLQTFGIGIDAKQLAATMGFPTDDKHAHTLTATAEGVEEAAMSMTQSAMGWRQRTPK